MTTGVIQVNPLCHPEWTNLKKKNIVMTMRIKRVIKLCHLDEGEILKRLAYKLARISPHVEMTKRLFASGLK